jgi:hypothetical protein
VHSSPQGFIIIIIILIFLLFNKIIYPWKFRLEKVVSPQKKLKLQKSSFKFNIFNFNLFMENKLPNFFAQRKGIMGISNIAI